jgi:carbohydrate diacid regulator
MVLELERPAVMSETIVERISDLLCCEVWLVNDHGGVVAQSCWGIRTTAHAVELPPMPSLRFAIQLNGQPHEVLLSAPLNGEVISPRLAQILVELITNEAAMAANLPNQDELKGYFIHDLLHGPTRDEATLLREGELLGMDLTRPRAVVLVEARDFILGSAAAGPEIDARLIWQRAHHVIDLIVHFFQLVNDAICAYIGNGEIAVLKASTNHDLVDWLDYADVAEQTDPSWANLKALKRAARGLLPCLRRGTGTEINIGLGRYHRDLSGLSRSYEDARAALALGRRFSSSAAVHCLDELGVAAFIGVADERTKRALAEHLLSPLDQETELLETLAVFIETNCCPSLAAARLNLHRNTLKYRFDKIASLTGLDVRRFEHAVQIHLCLVLRSLRR